MTFAKNAPFAGMKLTAICDNNPKRLNDNKNSLSGIKFYKDFDKFLKSGIDAVVLSNFFHEHVPFALKALKAGIHVMSETSACRTMAEGVELARAVEESGKIYMFAENYCYFNYIQEMRKLYKQGEIGEALFSQCEYIHPVSTEEILSLSPVTITGATGRLQHITAPMLWDQLCILQKSDLLQLMPEVSLIRQPVIQAKVSGELIFLQA